jgi:glycerol-3-phosphate acyltransferase PlsY
MDIATIAVIGVALVSYLIGSLTSSIETEKQLPHRY